MRKRWMLSGAVVASLGLWGCSSPPPLPPRRQKQPESLTVAEPPEGVLAPVDRWRRNLQEVLPQPWRLTGIEEQITAPARWTRLEGDRGLVIHLANGVDQQSFWVMPASFKGEVLANSQDTAARERSRTDAFILFEPAHDAPGWSDSQAVSEALGFETR